MGKDEKGGVQEFTWSIVCKIGSITKLFSPTCWLSGLPQMEMKGKSKWGGETCRTDKIVFKKDSSVPYFCFLEHWAWHCDKNNKTEEPTFTSEGRVGLAEGSGRLWSLHRRRPAGRSWSCWRRRAACRRWSFPRYCGPAVLLCPVCVVGGGY